VTSNYQTTNPVSPNFSQFEEMENKLFIGPKLTRNLFCFGPIKNWFSLTAQAEKNAVAKLGKTRFVVW